MLGGAGGDGAGDTVEALLEEVLEGPAGAVAGEHVQVVDVEVRVAVGLAGGGRVDLAEPVVGDDLAGGVEHHPAQRVALVGVGVDAPVGAVQVLGDGGDGVHSGALSAGDGGVGRAGGHEARVGGGGGGRRLRRAVSCGGGGGKVLLEHGSLRWSFSFLFAALPSMDGAGSSGCRQRLRAACGERGGRRHRCRPYAQITPMRHIILCLNCISTTTSCDRGEDFCPDR